ncbi:MAG: DNA gyrase inhibitor YacG [Deltaproteobacteria bacterium]
MVMKIKCPKCGKEVLWENNKWRPFCSERCRMVDLGAWISEGYKISGESSEEEAREPGSLPDEDDLLK